MSLQLLAFKFDDEDRAILEACAKHEKLTKSDIVRRAIRQYARSLGVVPEQQKPKRRKPK